MGSRARDSGPGAEPEGPWKLLGWSRFPESGPANPGSSVETAGSAEWPCQPELCRPLPRPTEPWPSRPGLCEPKYRGVSEVLERSRPSGAGPSVHGFPRRGLWPEGANFFRPLRERRRFRDIGDASPPGFAEWGTGFRGCKTWRKGSAAALGGGKQGYNPSHLFTRRLMPVALAQKVPLQSPGRRVRFRGVSYPQKNPGFRNC